jgi:enediyne biosynthesis protein E4
MPITRSLLVLLLLGRLPSWAQSHRIISVQPTSAKAVGFTRLEPGATGITFTNRLSDDAAAQNQIRLNGSGVAAGDVDGDGLVDLYFSGLEQHNALFRNLGNWRFDDVSAAAGLQGPTPFSSGALFADVDGDSDLDLLVTSIGGGTRLFLNDGKGKFTETFGAGLQRIRAGTTMAMADIDLDGDLDLYVANYRSSTIRSTGLDMIEVNGVKQIAPKDREDFEITPLGRILESGEADFLYENTGRGFAVVSFTGGRFLDEDGKPLARPPRDWGLTAMFRDLNGDGFPDLYVCNDFHSPDRIWINDGLGNFRAIARLALRNTSTFSMGVDFADIDRDGDDDFIVADMLDPDRRRRMTQISAMQPSQYLHGIYDDRPQFDRNTLQLNRGDGTYYS